MVCKKSVSNKLKRSPLKELPVLRPGSRGDDLMKKLLVFMLTAMMLTLTAVCFASDGKDIDDQQKVVDIFLSGKSYSSVKPFMAPEMQKSFNEKQYTEMMAAMKSDLGNLQDKDMVVFQKINGGDILRYLAKYEKGQVMDVIAVFKKDGAKFLLIDMAVVPPEAVNSKGKAENNQDQNK